MEKVVIIGKIVVMKAIFVVIMDFSVVIIGYFVVISPQTVVMAFFSIKSTDETWLKTRFLPSHSYIE